MAFLDLRRPGAASRLPLASALDLILIRPDRRMARGHKIQDRRSRDRIARLCRHSSLSTRLRSGQQAFAAPARRSAGSRDASTVAGGAEAPDLQCRKRELVGDSITGCSRRQSFDASSLSFRDGGSSATPSSLWAGGLSAPG